MLEITDRSELHRIQHRAQDKYWKGCNETKGGKVRSGMKITVVVVVVVGNCLTDTMHHKQDTRNNSDLPITIRSWALSSLSSGSRVPE